MRFLEAGELTEKDSPHSLRPARHYGTKLAQNSGGTAEDMRALTQSRYESRRTKMAPEPASGGRQQVADQKASRGKRAG